MSADQSWVRAVVALGGDQATAERSAQDLASRYDEPHRRYHGRSHVDAVLADADRLADAERLDQRRRWLLTLAVCAHDVVYEAKPGSDEQASADWARRQLTDARAPDDVVESVVALVLTTLTHSFEADDVVAAVLSDADLAILGMDHRTYDAYSSAVREEYASVPDDLWVPGRRAVLEQLLARPQIFVTATGISQWEGRARANIQRELRSLLSPDAGRNG